MLFPITNILLDTIQNDLFDEKQVSLSVLRLDALHPIVSGNKLFKLHYFLQYATQQSLEGIVTFGGAYSNHLVATAFACKEAGLKSTGIVRGEQPAELSHTLKACLAYDMRLKFISRQAYDKKDQIPFINEIKSEFKHHIIVPEGGYHPLGALGAGLIMDFIKEDSSHICCAVGTATTIAGLLKGIKFGQQIIAVPVLKNMVDLPQRIDYLTNQVYKPHQLEILNDYHFGGYAKKTEELIDCMNTLYKNHRLPTDFVYTGKMMFGIMDCIKKDFFKKGSKIVCIHTGGLQGNLSLKPGTLVF